MNALESLIDSLRMTLPYCTEIALTVVRPTSEWQYVVARYDDLIAELERARASSTQPGKESE